MDNLHGSMELPSRARSLLWWFHIQLAWRTGVEHGFYLWHWDVCLLVELYSFHNGLSTSAGIRRVDRRSWVWHSPLSIWDQIGPTWRILREYYPNYICHSALRLNISRGGEKEQENKKECQDPFLKDHIKGLEKLFWHQLSHFLIINPLRKSHPRGQMEIHSTAQAVEPSSLIILNMTERTRPPVSRHN